MLTNSVCEHGRGGRVGGDVQLVSPAALPASRAPVVAHSHLLPWRPCPDVPWHSDMVVTDVPTAGDRTALLYLQLQMPQAALDASWPVRSIAAGHDPLPSRLGPLAALLRAPKFSQC